MKRAWNVIWKLVLTLAIIGLVVSAIGWALGGFKPVQFSRNGAQVMNTHSVHIAQNSLDAFKAIDATLVTTDVQLVVGDHYGLTVDIDNTYMDVTWANQGGTLTLKESTSLSINFGIFNSTKGLATITVPSGVTIDTINVSTSTGSITLDVPATTITANSTTGDVTLTAATGTVDAHATTGDVSIQGDVGQQLTVSATTGRVTVAGKCANASIETSTGGVTVTGESSVINIRTTTGGTAVTQATQWSTANLDLRTTVGGITLNGPNAPRVLGHELQMPATAAQALLLTISTTTGGINVTLGA